MESTCSSLASTKRTVSFLLTSTGESTWAQNVCWNNKPFFACFGALLFNENTAGAWDQSHKVMEVPKSQT